MRRLLAALVASTLAAAAAVLAAAGEAPGQTVTAESRPAARSGADSSVVLGENLPVVEETLSNGMRFLVLPREGAPTVSFVVRYGVGSVNEHLGNTGIAHFLEHMLFKGTTTIGTRNVDAERALFPVMDEVHDSILAESGRLPEPDSARIRMLRDSLRSLEDSAGTFVIGNELDRIYSENGARNLNATTEMEGTTYFVQLPANRARLWFVLEADRMAHPVFREFYTERDVVAEERRTRIDDSPAGKVSQEHLASAFHAHPYGVPVIGYMSDIRTLTREQVRRYYEQYYGARNAVVAVVGDIEADSILRWAEDYLGRVPEGRKPGPVLTTEPEQTGERRSRVVLDAEPQIMVGWRVVDAFHDDTPALLMLGSLLTGGRTSRLERRLVREERIATYVTSSLGPGQLYPGLFGVQMVPRAPHTTDELEAALYEELDRLRRSPPDSAELERVRNQLEASRVRRVESNFGLAYQLAVSESLYGDWRSTFEYTRLLQEVTPADVRRVVETYFVPERRTVTVLARSSERGGGDEAAEEIGAAVEEVGGDPRDRTGEEVRGDPRDQAELPEQPVPEDRGERPPEEDTGAAG